MEDTKPSVTLKELCARGPYPRREVDELIEKLGIVCHHKGRGKTKYITEEEAMILMREMGLPKQLKSQRYWAIGLVAAPNPNWVYCKILELKDGRKHPVLIPRRFHGKLVGKRFPVERIQDKNGETWRHEWFSRLKSLSK